MSRSYFKSIFYKGGRRLVLTLAVVTSAGLLSEASAAGAFPRDGRPVQVGIASWYGHPHHGKLAASGEKYDMNRFTAAHRTLPFGTIVRVKNLSNDKTVKVKINDRGPFIPGRILDLSRAAARALEMEHSGVTRVRIEVVTPISRDRSGSG